MFFFFQAEDGIRDGRVTGVQTCALPIFRVFECIVEFDEATNRLRHARFSSAFCPILPERLGADDPNFSPSERQHWPPERPTSSSPSGSNRETSASICRPMQVGQLTPAPLLTTLDRKSVV